MRLAITAVSITLALCVLCVVPLPAGGQGPGYVARDIKGWIVDDDTGQPLEAVIVVARWEWLEPRLTLHGDPYRNSGDAIAIAEVVTARDGAYAIPGWGPKGKGAGRLDDHNDPKLSLFKSGYAPVELRNDWADYQRHNPAKVRTSKWNGQTIRLRRFTGTPAEYGEALATFQGDDHGGLWWRHQSDHWKAMPRMILALHKEKGRLDIEGRRIRGVNQLFGRSGRGVLLDAQSGDPVWPAIINVTWTMRRTDGTAGTRRLIQQKRSGARESNAEFYVSPWRWPLPQVPEWEVAPDHRPLVRVYAAGYRRLPDMTWEERGATLRMHRLPRTRDALLDELSSWRRDVDAELAANPDRREALAGQQHLLGLLTEQCHAITPDVRAGICFEPDSEVARYVEHIRSTPPRSHAMETREGTEEIRVIPVQAGGVMFYPPLPMPVNRAPAVGGFSIAPAAPAPVSPPGPSAP